MHLQPDPAHLSQHAASIRSFAEVLYLDSDNIALTDPTFLFEHPVYQERGAVFWPDFHKEVRQALV